jgi:uncharacterized membrane protein (UPF0127 family)
VGTSLKGLTSVFIALALILAFCPDWSAAQSRSNNDGASVKVLAKPTVRITLGTKAIVATLANTDKTRTEGLLGWSEIREDQGMLLDFIRSGVFAIHMQGMKFPIDAVWIDSNNVIKLIYEQIRPNSGIVYPSIFPVRYCLEIPAGFCKKHGIKEGQKVVFNSD